MARRGLIATFVIVGLVPGAPALADDNVLHIVQDGSTHSGFVTQTGKGNQAGTVDFPVHQQGVFDDLTLTQSGDDNDIGLSGAGLVQDGTASINASAANIATILQNSNGNSIGELVQTTLGTHPTTGNTLAITQDLKGSNTIGSVQQVQDDADSANFATITQTGFENWLDRLLQHTSSGEGANRVTLSLTGDYNGIDSGSLAGVGSLAILARSAGASSGRIVQDSDLSGGAANTIQLAITGDYNQFGLTQLGTDNSVGEAITGSDNSFATYQSGRHNQIVSGGIAGDGNDLGLRQTGESNIASAVLNWSSSDNEIAIGEDGDGNNANVSLKGDHGLVGASQSGSSHYAEITTVGDRNVVMGVQANAGFPASIGNSLTVTITGDGNNGLSGVTSRPFAGAALALAELGPSIPRSLLITPDATILLASLQGSVLLVPGLLLQWGDANEMDITVGSTTQSNDNLFAAVQHGDGNKITATVNGNANQFVVVQQGDDDVGTVAQSGNGNIAAISQ